MTSRARPGYGVEGFDYDDWGALVSYRKRDGNSLLFGRDAMSRVTSVDLPFPGGAFNKDRLSFTYDELGRLTDAKKGSGSGDSSARFEYEEDAGRLLKTEDVMLSTQCLACVLNEETEEMEPMIETFGHTLTYGYDGNSNVTSAMGQHTIPLYGNGQEPYDTIDSAYEYDDANRLTNATFATAAVTAYEYDPADRLLKRMPPNNAVTNFSYDPAGRLIGIHDRNPGLDENGYLEG